jgi:hypothetical protein
VLATDREVAELDVHLGKHVAHRLHRLDDVRRVLVDRTGEPDVLDRTVGVDPETVGSLVIEKRQSRQLGSRAISVARRCRNARHASCRRTGRWFQ